MSHLFRNELARMDRKIVKKNDSSENDNLYKIYKHKF